MAALIAVAESAVDIGSALSKFLDPVTDASAEITALVAECFSTSAALRNLDAVLGDCPSARRRDAVAADVPIVTGSLQFTFVDVRGILGELRTKSYRQVWAELQTHFLQESNNTLARRLTLYQQFIDGLKFILIEGFPNHDRFDELVTKIEKLYDHQRNHLVDDFGRTSLAEPSIARQLSFERNRPSVPDPRHRPPEFPGRATGPQSPTHSGSSGRPAPPYRATGPRSPSGSDYGRRLQPGRRATGPRSPMEYDYDDGPGWAGTGNGRGRPYGGDGYHTRGEDVFGGGGFRPPHAPEVPGRVESPSTSSNTFSSQASDRRSVTGHWLPIVYEQSLPTTPLTSGGSRSVSLTPHMPGASKRLAEEYHLLHELPFDDGDLIVRLYYRPEDYKSRILIRTLRPDRLRKDCCLPLIMLKIERSGPCLKLVRVDSSGRELETWACLKFVNYERLVLFFCTFLALRAEDTTQRNRSIIDSDMHNEKQYFGGIINDDNFEHGLRVFRDKDSKGIRLQASVMRGEMKRAPVWTAFITHKVLSPRWMTNPSSKVVHLAELQRFVFSSEYAEQLAPNGQHELSFTKSKDAREFMEAIDELAAEEEDDDEG